MKTVFFGTRAEEKECIEKWAEKYGYEVCTRTDFLTEENAAETYGYDAVGIVVNCRVTEKIAKTLSEAGVRYLLTRAAGTDHLDMEAIQRYNIKAANVPIYSPNAIAEHTILLTLSALRHLKEQIMRNEKYNFSIAGLQGRELRNMTVGIVGTGRIGCTTIQGLSGFGCKMLAYDKWERKDMKQFVTYVTLDELLLSSDVLIFHCPLTEDNYHMINEASLKKCKQGVVIVNCARGGLLDHEAVLKALKSGRVGALAMDVYEKEQLFLRKDKSREGLQDELIKELLMREDVIYTSHTAFYTDEAISNIIETSFQNLYEYVTTGECANEVSG